MLGVTRLVGDTSAGGTDDNAKLSDAAAPAWLPQRSNTIKANHANPILLIRVQRWGTFSRRFGTSDFILNHPTVDCRQFQEPHCNFSGQRAG
jgi:hypothetical protein